MGPDLRRPGQYHCLSCGAEDHEVFRVQDEYSAAWRKGEEVEFIQGYLATNEAYVAPGSLAQMQHTLSQHQLVSPTGTPLLDGSGPGVGNPPPAPGPLASRLLVAR